MNKWIERIVDRHRFTIIKKNAHRLGLDMDGDIVYFRGECYYVHILHDTISRTLVRNKYGVPSRKYDHHKVLMKLTKKDRTRMISTLSMIHTNRKVGE